MRSQSRLFTAAAHAAGAFFLLLGTASCVEAPASGDLCAGSNTPQTCECADETTGTVDCSASNPVCDCPDSDAGSIADIGDPNASDVGTFTPDATPTDTEQDTSPDCQELTWYADVDGDGFGDLNGTPIRSCDPVEDHVQVLGDCDDRDPFTYTGAAELCDGVDNNCNGSVDEFVSTVRQWVDADGDGHGDPSSTPIRECDRRAGYAPNNDDCDDDDDTRFPGNIDLCDDIDNDCDLRIDEDATFTDYWPDTDEDTFGDRTATPIRACAAPDEYVDNNGDCNDEQSDDNPDGTEVCDLRDNDCDGTIDDGVDVLLLMPDADNDGFGDVTARRRLSCEPIDGFVEVGGDCNDDDEFINPAADEVCDGADNDCDGFVDINAAGAELWFVDSDDDGFGANASAVLACNPPANASSVGGDCDDRRNQTNPDADEICDRLDNNCDGSIDEGVTNACGLCGDVPAEVCGDLLDNNCNGAIDEAAAGCSCDGRTDQPCYTGAPQTLGTGACRGGAMDCACPGGARICSDGAWGACEGEITPVVETCDGIDNDCDGLVDEGLRNACGTCGPAPTEVCNGVDDDCDGAVDEGLTLACGLCPGAAALTETCDDGLDNDCDGLVDEGCSCAGDLPCYPGPVSTQRVGACQDGIVLCYPGDTSNGVCTGAILPEFEVCDGIDNDCDGQIDISPDGCSVCGTDREVCDGVDNDCNGQIDEGLRNACGDCLDTITPEEAGGPTLCDGLDNDCDGFIDEGLLNACGTCGESCYADLTTPSDAHDLDSGAELIDAGATGNPTGLPGVTLSQRSFIPPFLWAANDESDTVTRFNTNTLREEGRYWVGDNPSRTAVDLDGNVWIGGRDDGRLSKILWDTTTCPDRNGNGRVDTSIFGALGPLNSAGSPLADECVVYSAVINPSRTSIRGIAADPTGRIWVGYTDGGVQSIDPYTFAVGPFISSAGSPRFIAGGDGVHRRDGTAVVDAGGVYGLVVDSLGYLYISSYNRDTISRLNTATGQWEATYAGICGSYGITVDANNRVWVGGWPTCPGVTMFDPATSRFHLFSVPATPAFTTDARIRVATTSPGSCDARGQHGCVTGLASEPATGNIWASFYNDGWTGRLVINEANFALSEWVLIPSNRNATTGALLPGVAADLRGVGFDGAGMAYILGEGTDRVFQVDPATNRRTPANPNGIQIGTSTHYTYSDFTGSTALSFTAPRAFWRYIFDTGVAVASVDGLRTVGFVPTGTSVGIRVRAVNAAGVATTEWTPAPLGDGTPQYHEYPTGAPSDDWTLPTPIAGSRFEIEARLTTNDSENRPVINSVELVWQRP
jgi:hypothetical protein